LEDLTGGYDMRRTFVGGAFRCNRLERNYFAAHGDGDF